MLSQIIRFYGHAMQGLMGSYLEKNLQTFADLQLRLAEQSKGLYDAQGMNPELWTDFLQGQAPVMQKLVGAYLEQSKTMVQQLQDHMAKQTEALLASVPGFTPPKKS
jgi:polyhydroxyalkanoate synthesis regulator protein